MSESKGRPRRSEAKSAETPQRGRPESYGSQPPAAAPAPVARSVPPTAEASDEERLSLPPGALVALRKSGGLVFRSREIVVYGDGRVETSAVGGGRAASAGAGHTLSGTGLAALRRALGRIDFDQLPATVGNQRPDSFVYEIAALVGGATRTAEVAEGQIPATVAPLIRQLNQLLISAG